MSKDEAISYLANQIMGYCKSSLLVSMRYLDLALLKLNEVKEVKPFTIPDYGTMETIATNGQVIVYCAPYVVDKFKESKIHFLRNILHIVLHCVLKHMFPGRAVDAEIWDLACDITVENIINDMNLPGTRSEMAPLINQTLQAFKKKLEVLNADSLYEYLYKDRFNRVLLSKLKVVFQADDHILWHIKVAKVRVVNGPASLVFDKNDPQNQSQKDENNQDDGGQQESKDKKPGQGQGQGQDGDNKSQFTNPSSLVTGEDAETLNEIMGASALESNELDWSKIAQSLQVDIETFSKDKLQGTGAGALLQNLKRVNREKYDYSAFLKKFATPHEVMKVSEDEFDYIFYTYGLKLYENLPLIEPLEYKDAKVIQDFVIAIDTSGSVSGDIVQSFINKTYNILKESESFTHRVNIHIIQCDADIQNDTKITSLEDLEKYFSNMELKGFGGTDFRPVFEYVEKLRNNGELKKLKGLIYFTDGYGTFPEKKPDYDTAFVFVDKQDYDAVKVPSWAIKILLESEEIKNMKK
ncbi:MAG: metallopeptidase [Clostridia bacterium]|nr:metallopeptidase [Clostridia bacterium]